MTASKASASKAKKASPPKNGAGDPLKVVTFRLKKVHRDSLAEYAIELARQQKPKRQISNNEAIQHMILHARVTRGEKVTAASEAKVKRSRRANTAGQEAQAATGS